MSILEKILDHKRYEIKQTKKNYPLSRLEEDLNRRSSNFDFYRAVIAPGITLIAEIKSASPSAGKISSLSPEDIARTYQAGPPRAISILTDERFFGQNLNLLKKLRKLLDKPILRKDFIIDEYQIYEAAAAGADAILLIALALSASQLKDYTQLANELKLDVLVEVHEPEELEKLTFSPRIIGINNRKLEGDMSTDLAQTERLLPCLPKKSAVISESGIKSSDDVDYLRNLGGIDGILVGTGLLQDSTNSDQLSNKLNRLIQS